MILRGRKRLLAMHALIEKELNYDEPRKFQLTLHKTITFSMSYLRRQRHIRKIEIQDTQSKDLISSHHNAIFRGRGWLTSEEISLLPGLIKKYSQEHKAAAFEKVASISPEHTLEILNGKDAEKALKEAIEAQTENFRKELQDKMPPNLDKYLKPTLYLHFKVNNINRGNVYLGNSCYISIPYNILRDNWSEFLKWKRAVLDLVSKLSEVKLPDEVQSE